jgi:hypothetical protein
MGSIKISPELDYWRLRLYVSLALAVALGITTLVVHLKLPGIMVEFWTAILSLLPISVVTRMCSEDLVL